MLRRLGWLSLCYALLAAGIFYLPRTQHVFWQTEAFSLRLLVPLAALLAFAARLGKGEEPASPQLRHLRGVLMLLIGIWFLSGALAFRQDLAAQELAVWLCYPLTAYAVWQLGSDARQRQQLITLILVAGTLQSLYGLIQSANLEAPLAAAWGSFCRASGLPSFGFDQLNWNSSFGGRAGGFLGNPNFLGGHLALLMPLALVTAIQSKSRRALHWLMLALMGSALVATQTRGAWIGAAAGMGLCFWLLKKDGSISLREQGKWLLGGLATLLLTAGAFFAAHGGNWSRLGSSFNGDEALSQRLTLMRIGSAVALAHPLLGAGPGNFRLEFPAHQAVGLTAADMNSRPYVVSEHAHNDLIQMAADCGLPALLCYLALLFLVFKALVGSLRQPEPLLAAGLIGGLAALQVHGLANFPFLIGPTQMTAWALAAIGLRSLQSDGDRQAAPGRPALWIGLLTALSALYLLNAYDAQRRLYKDGLWWMGAGELGLGHDDEGGEIVMRALGLDRSEDRLWRANGKSKLERRLAIDASGSFKEALRLNPHDHESRVLLARSLIDAGKFAEAELALQSSAQEAPNFPDVWEPMAAALYMQGKYAESVKAFDWAVYHHVKPAQMLENKSAALGSLGQYREALEALDQAEKLEPGRAKTHLNKAITYVKLGIMVMARQEMKKAEQLDPGDPQLKELKKVIR